MKKMMNETDTADDLFLVDDEDDSSQENKYLLFKLADEEYGVDISKVQSIEELQKVTPIPDMPAFIKGVINLRGKVIPVMDLRLRFRMGERDYDDRTCIIIVTIDSTTVGLIVDTVSEVHNIPEAQIEPAPDFSSDVEKDRYISGLGKVGDEVKIILDVNKIIQEQILNSLENAIN